MADKHDYQHEKAEEKRPSPFAVPRRQSASRDRSCGRRTPFVPPQWHNVQEDMPQSSHEPSTSHYVPDSTGQPHPSQEVWSTEDGVHHVISQSPGAVPVPYVTVQPGQAFPGGQPEVLYEWQDPYQPLNLSQEAWSATDGTHEASPSSSTAVQQIVMHPGQNQPVYFCAPNGEEGFRVPGYPRPMQESVSQEVVLQPPTPTMAPTVLFPGPFQARGPQMMFTGCPPTMMFYRTRSFGPCIIQLVCPFCTQQVRYEVRTIETVHTWDYFMTSTTRMIGRHFLQWRISTSDVDHRCPNCKRNLGAYIRDPNNWCR